MGTRPELPSLSGAESARNARIYAQLRAAQPPDREAMEELNEPFSVDEVGQVMAGLPNHKSADVHGLTCELLSMPAQVQTTAVVDGEGEGQGQPVDNDHVEEDFVCRPLVECVTTLMNGFKGRHRPPILRVGYLNHYVCANSRLYPNRANNMLHPTLTCTGA